MGQYLSKDDLELIDSSIYHFPYNKDTEKEPDMTQALC